MQAADKEFLGSFKSGAGYHRLDVAKAVNDWQKGLSPNYGPMMMAEMEMTAARRPLLPRPWDRADIAPCIEITWHEVGGCAWRLTPDDTTDSGLRTAPNGKNGSFTACSGTERHPQSTLAYRLNAEEKAATRAVWTSGL